MRTLYRSIFKEIGEKGNEKLSNRNVTVAGLGGVGSIVTSILAREDFTLRIIDKGRVEEADMNRMALYHDADITKFKAKQAKLRVTEINPKLKLKSFHEELSSTNVFLVKADCVIDCTNNDKDNSLIFEYCQKEKVPLILASYAGGVAEILIATKKLSKKVFQEYLERITIEKAGAISPATHMTAALAVSDLFKILLGKGVSKRITFDVWAGKYKEKKL